MSVISLRLKRCRVKEWSRCNCETFVRSFVCLCVCLFVFVANEFYSLKKMQKEGEEKCLRRGLAYFVLTGWIIDTAPDILSELNIQDSRFLLWVFTNKRPDTWSCPPATINCKNLFRKYSVRDILYVWILIYNSTINVSFREIRIFHHCMLLHSGTRTHWYPVYPVVHTHTHTDSPIRTHTRMYIS